jgi:tetratricopeptide (TPR) repeat protein
MELNLPRSAGVSTYVKERLARASWLLSQGQVREAITTCGSLLPAHSADPDVSHLLGLGYLKLADLQKAQHFLTAALEGAPASANILNDLGIVRVKQERYRDALECFSRSLDADGSHVDALNNIATTFGVLRQPAEAKKYWTRLTGLLPFSARVSAMTAETCLALNDMEEALRLARKGVRQDPGDVRSRLVLADTLEALGKFEQAKYQYLSMLVRDPSNVISLARLLSLKGTDVLQRHVLEARRLCLSEMLSEQERASLHFGLAQFYDRTKQYDLAFDQLEKGGRIRHLNHPFNCNANRQETDRLINFFTPDVCRSLAAAGSQSERPIFIVGMPRSGTTLVEQILASHSCIEAGGELPTIINLATGVSRAGYTYPEDLLQLDQQTLQRMASAYLERIDQVSTDADRVTDKMPFNFMHLGLISALFPKARIIHCRRDARDTCVSCLFTSFNEELQFATEFEGLAHYYLEYRRLMRHWKMVLPTQVLDIDYEQVVQNTTDCAKNLISFCGVEWQDSCLEFFNSKRGVRTPSRWQVRQPIYGRSIGRWRNYEKHIRPLLEGLSGAS